MSDCLPVEPNVAGQAVLCSTEAGLAQWRLAIAPAACADGIAELVRTKKHRAKAGGSK